jgi:hypothetical protein
MLKLPSKEVEETIKIKRQQLPTSNIDTPINTTYSPEMDDTEKLNEDDVT